MTYSEFRRQLGKAGISINEFAALMHVHPGSVSNYAKKNAVPHVYALTAVLLGDAGDRHIDFRQVFAEQGIRFNWKAGDSRVTRLDDYRPSTPGSLPRSSKRTGGKT